MNKKTLRSKRIGVLMGGTSAEREVSLRSGNAVLKALLKLKYNAIPIDAGSDLCRVLDRKKIDIAFIVLHGGHGENGAVQGLLEVKGIPYTGSGVLASALAMDKVASKQIFLFNDVPVPPFVIVSQTAKRTVPAVRAPFPLPWVVKPSTEGSSVGVSIVRSRKTLPAALRTAFRYGPTVIVERYIAGKEVQIGILNDRAIGGVEVRPSTEFYSYEAKYTAGMTQYILPPEIDRATYRRAEQAALAAHRALGCSGATRVDLIVTPKKQCYALEVNTIPGMTETSLLPKIAQKAGLSFPRLIDEILKGCLA